MKQSQSLKKGIAILVLLTAIGLPLACTTNNTSGPTSPGLPTHTPTPGGAATLTFTPTLPIGVTATFTPTFIATPIFVTSAGLSSKPNAFYSVPGSTSVVVAEGGILQGGDVTSLEIYTTGAVTAITMGNQFWEGIPTPGEQAVSYESHSAAGVFDNPQGIAYSGGYWATLDAPSITGVTGSDTLRAGDGNILSGYTYQEPIEYHSTSYGGSAFSKPQGMVADSQGRFYVADTGNKRIAEFGQLLPPGTYYNIVTNLHWLHSWGGSFNYTFKKPVAVACDLSDNVYVADVGTSNSVVQEYSPEGVTIMGTWTLANNCVANGLAVDGNGNFYVSNVGNGTTAAGRVEEYQINSPSSATLVRAWTVPLSAPQSSFFYPSCIALIGNSTLTTVNNILVGDQLPGTNNSGMIRVFGP